MLLTLGELVEEDLAVATGADDGVTLDPHDGEVVSVVPQDLQFCHIGQAGFPRAVDLPDLDEPAEGVEVRSEEWFRGLLAARAGRDDVAVVRNMQGVHTLVVVFAASSVPASTNLDKDEDISFNKQVVMQG